MILELLKSYQRNLCSVETQIERVIMRINLEDAKYNSIIHMSNDSIFKARELDNYFQKTNKLKGSLHGIPVLIKDNICTNDNLPTSCGSLILKDFYPKRNANIVDWLINEGAIIIGKTNMSEFSNYVSNNSESGYSSLGGKTNCIYGDKFPVGGSSSGSAVATAASFCCFSVGTETDGSLVYPAAHNGVFAFKLTPKQASTKNVIGISSFFDSIGFMSKNLSDLNFICSIYNKSKPSDEFIHKVFIQDESFLISGIEERCQNLLLYLKEFLLIEGIVIENGSFIENIETYFNSMDIICQTEFKSEIIEKTMLSKELFLKSCRETLLNFHYTDINEIERSFGSNIEESDHYQRSKNKILKLQELSEKKTNEEGIDLIIALTLGPNEVASLANLAGLNHLVIPTHIGGDLPISLSIMTNEKKAKLSFVFAEKFLNYLQQNGNKK